MESAANKEYSEFEEKVKRTFCIDDLGPRATTGVLRTAFEQFGNVRGVQFIPNYLQLDLPKCALVEMENSKQARAVVTEITDIPFMISGMPRPVRGKMAEADMFPDRPARPGRKIMCRWLEPGDPDFETAQKMKDLAKKHAAEIQVLVQAQREEEEKIFQNQEKVLKVNYKKYDMLESVLVDRSLDKLARYYGIDIRDD